MSLCPWKTTSDIWQNTFNQLGHTIDEKTADQSGKGLLTRLTEKVDHLLDQVSDP